ncbi:MAG TPA: hypothetical protein VEQ38_15475 [Verrucomicrobiae bacterium]|nr:hypothetical protein [Verrucomicrobiae bacterium]
MPAVLNNTRVPVRSGSAFRVDSPPANALVAPELAEELHRLLERFAIEAGASERRPVSISFKPGIFGHHQVGRAADIYAVNGIGLDEWKQRWDEAKQRAARAATPLDRRLTAETEEKENLGWRLYKVLQRYGRWAQPYGYPIQLFGPWTRSEGPWKPISDFLLRAHRDHIHLAK